MGLGSLTFVIPHFIAQKYVDEEHVMKNVTEKNICKPTTTTIDNQPGYDTFKLRVSRKFILD